MEKLWDLFEVEIVPISKTSVFLLFSLRNLEVNHDLISVSGPDREVGGRDELGFEGM